MKKLTIVIMMLGAALFAASCTKEEPTQLKLDKKNISCTQATQEKVTVTTNYDWTASCNASWAHLSATSGSAGTSAITISIDDPDLNPRSTMVVISSRELRDTVTISQGQLDKIVLEKAEILLASGGGDFEVKVNCNVDFNVEIPTDVKWLKTVETKTYGTRTVKMSCDANDTYDDREAKVTFKSADGRLSDVLTVHQSQFDEILLKEHSTTVPQAGGSFTVTVCANVDFDVTIPEEADWIVREEAKGLSEYNVTFTCSENEDYDERQAELTFSSKDGALKETFTVTQDKARAFGIDCHRVDLGVEGGGFSTCAIGNVPYEVIIPEEATWITRTPTKGIGYDQIMFECAANEEYDERSADIVFYAEEVGVSDTLTVHQEGKTGLFVTPDTLNVGCEARTMEIILKYNLEYEVSCDCDWLSATPAPATKGLESMQYLVDISSYDGSGEPREGHIFFKAEGVSAKLTVIQQARELEVLSFVHMSTSIGVPKVSGDDMKGSIDWGDSSSDEYSIDATHKYADRKKRTVTMTFENAGTAEFRGISGLYKIDFSNF